AVRIAGKIAPQRPRGDGIRTRRAAEAEVDAARIERGKRAELLGDDERRMVRQHDAAGADTDRFRAFRDISEGDRGRGARNTGHSVMFGEPEAGEAEIFGMTGKVAAGVERVGDRAALAHRGEIED